MVGVVVHARQEKAVGQFDFRVLIRATCQFVKVAAAQEFQVEEVAAVDAFLGFFEEFGLFRLTRFGFVAGVGFSQGGYSLGKLAHDISWVAWAAFAFELRFLMFVGGARV